MLRLFPTIPTNNCTPASSLVTWLNDSNIRIIPGSATLPEGNIVYPASYTLTSFTTPTPTVHCSNSTSYDVSVTISYTWDCYDPDIGHETKYTSYSREFPAGANFDDNGFSEYAQQPGGYSSTTVTARSLSIRVLPPAAYTHTKVQPNIISEN